MTSVVTKSEPRTSRRRDNLGFKSDDDPVVTGAVLANRIGASTRTVGNLAAKGVAVRGPNGRGFYLWASIGNAFKELRSAAAGRASVSDVRKRVLNAQAQKLEHDLEVAQGKYWLKIEAMAVFSASFQRMRGHMVAVHDRIRTRLPHLTNHDIFEIEQEIIAAIVDSAEAEKAVLDREDKAERDSNDETKGIKNDD